MSELLNKTAIFSFSIKLSLQRYYFFRIIPLCSFIAVGCEFDLFLKKIRGASLVFFCAFFSIYFQNYPYRLADLWLDNLLDLREMVERWKRFHERWRKAYPFLDRKNSARIGLYFTYLKYDLRIRGMIYSTNWIERLNRMYKRVTRMRGALPNTESALLLLCNVAMDVEAYRYPVTSFRFENANFRWDIG